MRSVLVSPACSTRSRTRRSRAPSVIWEFVTTGIVTRYRSSVGSRQSRPPLRSAAPDSLPAGVGRGAVERHDGAVELVEKIETGIHLASAILLARAEGHDRLDHGFHRLDLVVADDVADERFRSFAHHSGSGLDGVDADAGAVQLDRECVRCAVERSLGGTVDTDLRGDTVGLEGWARSVSGSRGR